MEGKWLLKDLKKQSNKRKRNGKAIDVSRMSERTSENRSRIQRYKRLYDTLEAYRRQRKRCYNFFNNNQWEDLMVDPDDACGRRMITEREYHMRQGHVPLSNNLILKDVNFVLGLIREGHKKPMACATNSADQDLSDMVSNAMYFAYNSNDALNIDAEAAQEMLIGGIAVSSVRPNGMTKDGIMRMKIVNDNPAMMFFDGDVQDIRMNGINCIGFLRSYTKTDLLKEFAKSPEEREWLLSIYERETQDINSEKNPFDPDRYNNEDFYIPFRRDLFRVIEAWEECERPMIRYHDRIEGKVYTTDVENEDKVARMSIQKVQQAMDEGFENYEDYALDIEYFSEKFWMVRYLTPYGDELLAMECPYKHGLPPYTMRAYRMVNGNVVSWVSNLIPQQKFINRYISMMDFQQGSAAKGVLIFPEELKPKNVSHKQIANAWSKSNSVIFANMRPGVPMPQQFNANAINNGEIQMLQIQQQLLEEISGVRGAATGATASQGTPSSLYAQESQNAIINLRDVTDFFMAYIKARNLKLMQVILQYQTSKADMFTVGGDFSESAMTYDPDKIKDVTFDLVPAESSINVPAYTMYQNDILKELAIAGTIPAKVWFKRAGFPYSNALMRDLEVFEQQQLALQQQTIAAQQPNKNPMTGVEGADANIEKGVGQEIIARSNVTPQQLTQAVGGMNANNGGM